MRLDLTQIKRWIPKGSRVLDLGCGDGEFLAELEHELEVSGTGLEIDLHNLSEAVAKGLSVVQQDMDAGLPNFPDNSFDTVVMAHALQVLHRPHRVLEHMVRIGGEAIVTFPNFGHWRCRLYLGLRGRMPVSKVMPYSWYDTPNIHFCTVKDFEHLCDSLDIELIAKDTVGGGSSQILARLWPNAFAVTAIYRLRRRGG
ncbi:methionine biosynthesis protein MetW [Luminiphilus syltensis]|nr:methionine biosynthesis protein MetW [Luminiphilus syltensis]